MVPYPAFRFMGRKGAGYDVISYDGAPLGHVERVAPRSCPYWRVAWIAVTRSGDRFPGYTSRFEAADSLLAVHLARTRRATLAAEPDPFTAEEG